MDAQDLLNNNTNTYKTKAWFQLQCDKQDTSHLRIKARILYTFKHTPITGLYLFDEPQLQRERSRTSSQRTVWSRRVHHGIRRLFDCIVTRWVPDYLSQAFIRPFVLHGSLSPDGLLSVPLIFGSINRKDISVCWRSFSL